MNTPLQQQWLKQLHANLSQLEQMLVNRTVPPNWNCEEAQVVREVQEIIEALSRPHEKNN